MAKPVATAIESARAKPLVPIAFTTSRRLAQLNQVHGLYQTAAFAAAGGGAATAAGAGGGVGVGAGVAAGGTVATSFGAGAGITPTLPVGHPFCFGSGL